MAEKEEEVTSDVFVMEEVQEGIAEDESMEDDEDEEKVSIKAEKKAKALDKMNDVDPEEILKNYYETFTKEEKVWYRCKFCADWKTDYNSTMRDHVNSKHMRIMLKCTHCEFETLRFKTLNFHRRSKHNLSAMCCPQDKCTFKTILVERLRDHLIKKHEMERELAKESVAIMLVEGGEGVTCNLDDDLVKGCGKPKRMKSTRTSWASGWKNKAAPQRKTDEERQYRIIVNDQGEKTGVQCLYCDFATRLPSNMPGHINAKHLNKHIKCPECTFSTYYPKNLACHMKKLHGRSTRQCYFPNCKFRFFQDEKMHIHLMEKHNCVYDQVKNAIYIDV